MKRREKLLLTWTLAMVEMNLAGNVKSRIWAQTWSLGAGIKVEAKARVLMVKV